MDIVMITRDRPELTKQTIDSMAANAKDWGRHRLLMVFDGTGEEYFALFRKQPGPEMPFAAKVTGKQLGVGGAKNFGAAYFQQQAALASKVLSHRFQAPVRVAAKDDTLLMFTDNDMYYLPNWDERLEHGMLTSADRGSYITQLGGWKHPFHQLGHRVEKVSSEIRTYEVDAVTGNCFVIRWSDWSKYGPFDANAVGPGQSEDFALSQKIKQRVVRKDLAVGVNIGDMLRDEEVVPGVVATLVPPVAIHCGIANSEGQPATGWKEMIEMAERQLKEHGLEGKVTFALPVPDAPPFIKPAVTGKVASFDPRIMLGPPDVSWDGNAYAKYGDTARESAGLGPSPIPATDALEAATDRYVAERYGREIEKIRAREIEMFEELRKQGVKNVPPVPPGKQQEAKFEWVGGLEKGPDGTLKPVPIGNELGKLGFTGFKTGVDPAPDPDRIAFSIGMDPKHLAGKPFEVAYPAGDPRMAYLNSLPKLLSLNIGSGQRRFETTGGREWVNVDVQSVPPDRVADVVCDVGAEHLPYDNGQVDLIVLHHVIEHLGCGEATPMLEECWRVLRSGGSMIICVPDMQALAGRWLGGDITDQIYFTNVYGAYMGDEADRHRWGYTPKSLRRYLAEVFREGECDQHSFLDSLPEGEYGRRAREAAALLGDPRDCELCGEHIKKFDWREIPGASIARDWWVLAMEVVKP